MADSQRKSYNLIDEQYGTITTTIQYIPLNVGEGTFTLSTTTPIVGNSACLFFLAGNVSSGASGGNNVYLGRNRTVTSIDGYVTIGYRTTNILYPSSYQTMLNSGSTALPYEPYGWVHSLRKMSSATETIQSGDTIYANGQPITTYTIKGNEEHTGTPSPQNPVMPNGTGNKTANLFNKQAVTNNERVVYTDGTTALLTGVDVSDYIPLETGETYTLNISSSVVSKTGHLYAMYDNSKNFVDTGRHPSTGAIIYTFTVPNGVSFIRFNSLMTELDNVMLVKGSYTAQTFPPYEPYGYKIPISSGQTALNPMYLTGQLMKIDNTVDSLASSGTVTYNIAKYEFTGQETWYVTTSGSNTRAFVQNFSATIGESVALCDRFAYTDTSRNYPPLGEFSITSAKAIIFGVDGNEYADATAWKAYVSAQYAAGTPLTIWYQLKTPTTETVTAPPIPTTEGANSITVDTTVQPSEFTATWTGWHDSSVKEKSENLWNEDYTDISSTATYVPLNVGEGNYTLSTTFQAVNDVTDIFLLSGNVTSGISSSDNGAYAGKNVTKASIDGYVTIAYRNYARTTTGSIQTCQTMLNSGSTAQTYAPYWE